MNNAENFCFKHKAYVFLPICIYIPMYSHNNASINIFTTKYNILLAVHNEFLGFGEFSSDLGNFYPGHGDFSSFQSENTGPRGRVQ